MENESKYVCRRRKVENVYEIECTDEHNKKAEPKKMYCLFTSADKSGGASGLGFGAQYGQQIPVLKCFPEDEFPKEIAKELGTEPDNVRIIDDDEQSKLKHDSR